MRGREWGWLILLLAGGAWFGRLPDRLATSSWPQIVKASGALTDTLPVSGTAVPQDYSGLVETQYDDYQVRVYGWNSRPGFGDRLEVWKGSRRVYSLEESGNVGLGGELLAPVGPPPWNAFGRSVTGDGVPTLVIKSEAGWHQRYRIVHLGELLKVVPLAGRSSEIGTLVPSSGESVASIFWATDDTFEVWLGAHADAAFGQVPLRYNGSAYLVAPDLMRRAAPEWSVLEGIAVSIKEQDWGDHDQVWAPESLRQQMLDLIYSGHGELAWRFYRAAWRPGVAGEEEFLGLFKMRLKQSRYWPYLKALNQW